MITPVADPSGTSTPNRNKKTIRQQEIRTTADRFRMDVSEVIGESVMSKFYLPCLIR
jgi:hypothetical protein